jgi:hypothetical protein
VGKDVINPRWSLHVEQVAQEVGLLRRNTALTNREPRDPEKRTGGDGLHHTQPQVYWALGPLGQRERSELRAAKPHAEHPVSTLPAED